MRLSVPQVHAHFRAVPNKRSVVAMYDAAQTGARQACTVRHIRFALNRNLE
jgi:hypothetical protein